MSKTISLNMIVKNENHIIEKTLSHLLEKIDISYWVICDTGSTDGTQSIIRDFFKQKNIKGELLEHEWRDFGYNRSLALEAVYNKSDYVLIFDADDYIHGEIILPDLNYDMYHLKLGKDFVYKRPLLVNNRLRWKFVGVLHEFLSCIDEFKTQETIEGDYYIESGKSGFRSFDKNKYSKDALILENAYNTETDNSLKERYAFYCAQSYMDANEKVKSIEWYKKVTQSNNWKQEKYYSCLMIAKQVQEMENYDKYDVIKYLMLAETFDNERFEHITRLSSFLHHNGLHMLVSGLYVQNKHKKRKFNDINSKLFLSMNDYDYSLEYYTSISAYYSNDYNSGYECCKKIICNELDTYTINKTHFNITLNNLYFYKELLKQETDYSVITTIFNELNTLIQTKSNDHLNELWNILFDKMKIGEEKIEYEFKNKANPIVFLSFTTCKRYNLFEKTINSILKNWIDCDKVDYWFCVDDNSNEDDKNKMMLNYPFIDYYFKTEKEKGHRKSMNIIWDKLNELKPKYWIHMEDDFVFFDKMSYISKAIEGIELLEKQNVKQILFNKSYAEIIEDYRINGAINEGEFAIHVHNKDNANYINNHYWPHYSFRPSLISADVILSLGNFDSHNQFFELDYANRWNDAGYKSGFFNKITNKHIGRLTKNRNDSTLLNAYDLNAESQFVKEQKFIKIVNLLRRSDRKENMIQLLKSHNISSYEFFEAVDGTKLTSNDPLDIFYGNDFGNRLGFLGCALSHINLWKQLLKDNENNFYLIMEDDVELVSDFKENIYKLKPVMNTKELLFLGYSMFSSDRKKYETIYSAQTKNVKVLTLNKDIFTGGTFCYSINKKGAKHLLDHIDKHGAKNGIDYIMGKLNHTICYEIQPHICFSEWIERNNCTKQLDTDIQNNCESVEIKCNNVLKDYNDALSQFVFIKNKDQIDNDLFYSYNTLFEYMKMALNDNTCIGFNTLGFFKNKLTKLTTSQYFHYENDGMYIKKDAYEKYLNENLSTEEKNEIITKQTDNNEEKKNEDTVVTKPLTKNKIRIKLICNWCPSIDFCKEWSNLFETENTWKNIEITHEDNNIDYYVIINYPYNEEYYEPSKSLIFQMEPWVYDESKNWGVKCWRHWSNPDESKFLYVGTHKKTLNNVQWQINIPSFIPNTRLDRVICVLSAKKFDIGHMKRINFIKFCENIKTVDNDTNNESKIDVFGRSNYHRFKNYIGELTNDKKENHYINYKYCLAVENNMETNYATEKIWESILCECLTFYWGCPNLEEYIDSNAFVRLDLNDFEESMNIIHRAIEEDWWSQRIDIIRKEKHRLISELGFFPKLKQILDLA